MDKSNRLYSVVKKFSDLDLYPAHVDSMKMGYIFEDIIRRFSENAEAGDHYTPREVIRLMVNVLLAEGCNDLLTDEGKIATVLAAACGSGGMLSTTYDFLRRKIPMWMCVCLDRKSILNPTPFAWQICSSKDRM